MQDKINNMRSVSSITERSRNNVVKVSFYSPYLSKNSKKKNLRMQLSIGNDIAKELQWKDGDRIDIKADDKQLILSKLSDLIKIDDGYQSFKGYKFKKISKSYSFCLNFRSFIVPKNNKIRIIPHDVIKTEDIKYLKILLEDQINENS